MVWQSEAGYYWLPISTDNSLKACTSHDVCVFSFPPTNYESFCTWLLPSKFPSGMHHQTIDGSIKAWVAMSSIYPYRKRNIVRKIHVGYFRHHHVFSPVLWVYSANSSLPQSPIFVIGNTETSPQLFGEIWFVFVWLGFVEPSSFTPFWYHDGSSVQSCGAYGYTFIVVPHCATMWRTPDERPNQSHINANNRSASSSFCPLTPMTLTRDYLC